jgi:hypothetical protein
MELFIKHPRMYLKNLRTLQFVLHLVHVLCRQVLIIDVKLINNNIIHKTSDVCQRIYVARTVTVSNL